AAIITGGVFDPVVTDETVLLRFRPGVRQQLRPMIASAATRTSVFTVIRTKFLRPRAVPACEMLALRKACMVPDGSGNTR
ncbi:hypothetical protein AB0H83_21225, partial [Dactylosporangium sp. NPDC050688]|uniref:hypothetical protein n=1 Tax=Dactylosporangium sp. NPDC050688 TaxID=3157217 RepID=UPI0033D04A6A